MDTNLKKGKALVRIVCGWLAVLCLIGGVVCTVSIYPQALSKNNFSGIADLYAGRITGLPGVQRQIAVLFYNAQIAEGSGQNLSQNQRIDFANNALQTFEQALPADGLLYTFQPYKKSELSTNSEFPLFDAGTLSPPPGYSVLVATDGTQYWGSYAIIDAYYAYANTQSVQPDLEAIQKTKSTVALMLTDTPISSNRFGSSYHQARQAQVALIVATILFGAALLLGLVCLVLFRQAKPGRKWVASGLAHIPLEIKLLATGVAFYSVYLVVVTASSSRQSSWLSALAVCGWPTLWLLCVDFAHNKTNVFKNSLCWRFVRFVCNGTKAFAASFPWQKRSLALLVASVAVFPIAIVLCVFIFSLRTYFSYQVVVCLGVLVLAGMVALFCLLRVARLIQDMGKISNQINQLRTGNEPSALPLDHKSALHGTATDLNALQAGITQMVDARTKAERMKVELITNVSHDLKTPLTSIISYTQLLQDEPLDGAAKDYAAVIARKADQLKTMVQDVFELSKASSGELVLQPEPLDLVKLLSQTLADMDESIAQSGFALRTNLPQSVWVCVDGDHMYRVFQNLLCNALQYSLPGSRIYLDAVCTDTTVITTVKNISKNEITFTPDSIVERFVRADESRSGEGHGLGLSIAKSFTEACGGRFSIETQADLFCASVGLDIVNQPQMQKEEPPVPQPVDTPEAATAGA